MEHHGTTEALHQNANSWDLRSSDKNTEYSNTMRHLCTLAVCACFCKKQTLKQEGLATRIGSLWCSSNGLSIIGNAIWPLPPLPFLCVKKSTDFPHWAAAPVEALISISCSNPYSLQHFMYTYRSVCIVIYCLHLFSAPNSCPSTSLLLPVIRLDRTFFSSRAGGTTAAVYKATTSKWRPPRPPSATVKLP